MDPGDRFMGHVTGETRREEPAGAEIANIVAKNRALRQQALGENVLFQKLGRSGIGYAKDKRELADEVRYGEMMRDLERRTAFGNYNKGAQEYKIGGYTLTRQSGRQWLSAFLDYFKRPEMAGGASVASRPSAAAEAVNPRRYPRATRRYAAHARTGGRGVLEGPGG